MTLEDFIRTRLIETPEGMYMPSGDPVMEKDERTSIEESIHKIFLHIHPRSVLEIGFGYGYTATIFENYGVEHILCELHPQSLPLMRAWGEKYPTSIRIEGSHMDAPKRHYDLIYYDPYPGLAPTTFKDFDFTWLAPCMMRQQQVARYPQAGFWFTHRGVRYWQELYQPQDLP